MTSDDTINKYLRDTLNLIINDPDYLVIKADQNSPRDSKPYCTVKVMSSRSESLEELQNVDEGDTDTLQTTKAMRSILVSFNFFKNGAVEHDPFYIANLCRQALWRDSISEFLYTKDLGLAKRSQVKNTTFELDNGFEERANFTATFNFVDTDSEILTTISEAEVSGTVDYIERLEELDININNN